MSTPISLDRDASQLSTDFPEMQEHWHVEVSVGSEALVSIGENWLSGKAPITDADEQTIIAAAQHLIAFACRTVQPSVDAAWPKLDAPAKVGAGTFGKGVSSRYVVEACQRAYEVAQKEQDQPRSPEQLQERERGRRKLWNMIHGDPNQPELKRDDSIVEVIEDAFIEGWNGCMHKKNATQTIRKFLASRGYERSNPDEDQRTIKGWKRRVADWLIARSISRPPDFVIGSDEDPYLLRWWLIPRNPIFNVYLHCFMRSDDDRALHDHPWGNCSILLRGRYREHSIDAGGIHHHQVVDEGSVRVRPSGSFAHRIELIDGYCWTLFITGPRYREWGFHCPEAGWIPWQQFTTSDDKGTAGKGCEQ